MQNRIGLLLFAFCALLVPAAANAAPKPPVAPIAPVTDNDFGTSVVDPYRWMEQGTKDPRFVPLLRAQNAYTAALLAPLAAQHNALRNKLLALSTGTARISSWQQAGGKLFYEQLNPDASVAVLNVREKDGSIRTLFDPAKYGNATSHAAIDYFSPSFDGSRVAVGVALGGSENDTIRVIETQTGTVLPDTITRAEYGFPAWRADGTSFYYSRLQALPPGSSPTQIYVNQRGFLHVLGTDPDKDKVVFGPGVDPAITVPADGFNTMATIPGAPYVIAFHSAGTTDPGSIYVSRTGDAPWARLTKPEDHMATNGPSAIAFRGTTLFVLFQDVPNGRIATLDLAHPSAPPVTIVPESDRQIEGVFGASDSLYVEHRDGLAFSLEKLSDSGKHTGWVPLPYAGALNTIDASPGEAGIRFEINSWVVPPALIAYDPTSEKASDTGVIPKDPSDISHIIAREVTAPSTDGASVPISIIVRDDIKLDGTHPTLFEGYGAYGIAIDPAFSATQLEWVRRGGVLAIAHVRGGGEYGERWHVAGQKATKQHTVDDMIATARYLIAQKYTSPQHLAVRGTSAGGVAVGGAIVQAPELFAAAVDNVGMTNLTRFQQTQGGAANVPEFGDITVASDFAYIYPLDAYQHVKNGTHYPAVMGVTGLNDPRVPPWMIAKMIARLQAATSSKRPVVLRADFDAGHGFGTSRTQAVDERADEWTFLLWQLGDPAFQPK